MSECKHEGCITWRKPVDRGMLPEKPYMFCRLCQTWQEIIFKK